MRDPFGYYEVVATILPVLFVALIYQAQLLERSPLDSGPRQPKKERKGFLGKRVKKALRSTVANEIIVGSFALYLLAITAVGEYVALHALSSQRMPGHEGHDLVGISLYASALTLLFQRIRLAIETRLAHHEQPPSPQLTSALVTFYLVTFAVGLLALSGDL